MEKIIYIKKINHKKNFKLLESVIYDILNCIIKNKNIDAEKYKNIDIIKNEILKLSTDEFSKISKSIYIQIKFTNMIKKIFDLDSQEKVFDVSINNFVNMKDLYNMLNIELNSSYLIIKNSFETFFNSIKNPNNNILNHNQMFIIKDETIIIKETIGYYILLNHDTKKIYDKFYWINKLKNVQLENINNKQNFLSIYENICTSTNLTFGYDYNSNDFTKTIKYIFKNYKKKTKENINPVNSMEKLYEKSFLSKNSFVFDEKYENYIPDKNLDFFLDKKLHEFLDLYKLFELNIDMSQEEIEQKFYLEEEKINLQNDIIKYVGFNILLNKKTRKIYDNYYLDYYIENWDKISIEFSDKYITNKNLKDDHDSIKIQEKINFVYSKLFNPDTTISDEKLNSDQVSELVDKYNKECEDFIVKHENKEKTPEELEEIYKKMMNELKTKNNYNYDPSKLNQELEKFINDRNIFIKSLKTHEDKYKEINEIIIKYNEFEITSFELLDYNKYKSNQKYNKLPTGIANKENSDVDIVDIELSNFDIEDFKLWRIQNNKLNKKISDSDYYEFVQNINKNNIEFEKKHKNNFDILQYYFNNNNN
jgi:hypothetical protein